MRTITERNLKCFEDLEELDSRQISHMVSILLDNANKRMFAKLDLLRENEI
jgi:hypothetical protein